MNEFLKSLRNGGASYSVEWNEAGFALAAAPGFETAFNTLSRTVADRVDPSFHAFLRADDNGGYDRVQIMVVPEDPASDGHTGASADPPKSVLVQKPFVGAQALPVVTTLMDSDDSDAPEPS